MAEEKNTLEYGLIKTFCPHLDITDCSGLKCGRGVKFMDECFIDSMTGNVLCKDCGQCLRYERKMAERRKAKGIPDIKINGE
jgi:hypothetical protein